MGKPLRPLGEESRDLRYIDLDLFWPSAACGALVLLIALFLLKNGSV